MQLLPCRDRESGALAPFGNVQESVDFGETSVGRRRVQDDVPVRNQGAPRTAGSRVALEFSIMELSSPRDRGNDFECETVK